MEEHFYLLLPFVLVAIFAAGKGPHLIVLSLSTAVICLALRFVSVSINDAFATSMAATHLRIDALMAGVAIRGAAQYYPEIFFRSGNGAAFWQLQESCFGYRISSSIQAAR